MPNFGNSEIGATAEGFPIDYRLAYKFNLPEDGDVTAIEVYCDGNGPNQTGNTDWRGAIYADSSGNPAGRLAYTNDGAIAPGASAAWRSLSLTASVELLAGDYWLVFQGGGIQTARWYYDVVTDAERWAADAFAGGIDANWGSPNNGSKRASLRAVYTPVPPPPNPSIRGTIVNSDTFDSEVVGSISSERVVVGAATWGAIANTQDISTFSLAAEGSNRLWDAPNISIGYQEEHIFQGRVANDSAGLPRIILVGATNRDMVIVFDEPLLNARIELYGGRNVYCSGGEIERTGSPIGPDDSSNLWKVPDGHGIQIYRQAAYAAAGGIVDLSAIHFHGNRLVQPIYVDAGPSGVADFTLQVQKCLLEGYHPVGNIINHTDGIQLAQGPKNMNLGYLTIKGPGTGLQMQPNNYNTTHTINLYDRRFVSVEQVDVGSGLAAYALWKTAHQSKYWTENNEECYVKKLAGSNLAWAQSNAPNMEAWNPPPAEQRSWTVTGEDWNVDSLPATAFAQLSEVGVGKTF